MTGVMPCDLDFLEESYSGRLGEALKSDQLEAEAFQEEGGKGCCLEKGTV